MRAPLRLILVCLLAAMPALAFSAPARRLDPDLSSLSSLPMHRTAGARISKALTQVRNKSEPVQFAVATPLSVGLDGGLWDRADATTDRWRVRISSAGAVGLGLEFSRFDLPEGAALWIYDDAGQQVQGPYTHADQTVEGKLWTAIVPGSSAVLELQVPSAERDAVKLELAQVDHAFLDIGKAAAMVAAKSGSCNVDMICSDGNNWRDEGRAVAMISIGNTLVCSGQLLNNARQNKDPLFLTANHCQIGQTADTPASSVVFYWNYQTSSCGGTPNGGLSQNQSGATLLAGDVGSDFTLLRLNKQPSSDYKVYFAGWDAGSAIPQSGVAIHHPQGEEKRISTYSTAAVRQTVCLDGAGSGGGSCTRSVTSWQVNWARGVTESGSSGSGLWNQNHRLVGVLSGGDTSCGNTSGEDYFARLETAYTAKPAASGQLKAWLDPDDSGITGLNGRDSSSSVVTAVADTVNIVGNTVSNLLNVLSNDSTSGSGPLTITSVTGSAHGGTVAIVDNALVYTPATGFVGTDSFSYTVSDGASSAVVPVTVVVAEAASGGGGGSDSSGGGGGAMQWPLLLVLGALAMARLLSRRAIAPYFSPCMPRRISGVSARITAPAPRPTQVIRPNSSE